MVRRRARPMSQKLKEEIAKELGFYDRMKQDGWAEMTSREAGDLVKRALELAEERAQSRKQT